MKKLICPSLIVLALISVDCIASQSTKTDAEPSYACKVMLERGSTMFCSIKRS